MSDIARYYDASKNPDGAGYAGVPLDDISKDQFDALPAYLQDAVDKHPMYRKTKPSEAASASADKPKADKPKANKQYAKGGAVTKNIAPIISSGHGPEIFIPSTQGVEANVDAPIEGVTDAGGTN